MLGEQGSVFVIKIPDKKAKVYRSFTVQNEYAPCVQKYKKLRPATVPHDRVFVNYQYGKCTVQPIGKNKFANTPKVIANFLNLKDVENYTLHSYRKMKHGVRSSSVSDNYTEEEKRKIDDSNCVRLCEDEAVSVEDVCEDFKSTAWDSLPSKSRESYVRAYSNFLAWKVDEKIDKECFSEAVILQYFTYLKTIYRPTSLWAEYSKLKATIQKNDNIDISYPEVRSFLRTTASGYLPQKCNVFQPDDIRRFLSQAGDKEFLVVKVIMIFGLYGATSAGELTKVEVDDVSEQGSVFVIKIHDAKSNVFRSFTVENEYAAYVQKYKNLRPKSIEHKRFFIQYENGRCTTQVIGRNKFANMPKVIDNFLRLDDADNYGSHSFRKTSKKLLLADGNVDMLITKHHSEGNSLSNVQEPIDDHILQINFKSPVIQNVSTITSSMVTPTVASTSNIPTGFQTYQGQPHKTQPYQLFPYGTSIVNAQPPKLLPIGSSTLNIRADDVYVPPGKILQGTQYNHYHI